MSATTMPCGAPAREIVLSAEVRRLAAVRWAVGVVLAAVLAAVAVPVTVPGMTARVNAIVADSAAVHGGKLTVDLLVPSRDAAAGKAMVNTTVAVVPEGP